MIERLPERFRSKFQVNPDTGCWEWTASMKRGWPRYYLSANREIAAHRFAYDCLVEPIENGKAYRELRAECSNRRCVNPAHFRLATSSNGPTCPKCGEADITKFPPCRKYYTSNGSARPRGSSLCTKCVSARKRERYQTDPDFRRREIRNGRLSRIRRMHQVDTIKSSRGCSGCGERHPGCLEFHHPDPMAKQHNVSVAIARCIPWETILAEIEKCVVLCANCHRKHHWEEQRARHQYWIKAAA